MRILVLGTSNSIIRDGWTNGFSEEFPDCIIENQSVGVSPGIQFALNMDLDFNDYDFVVLDSITNDEEHCLEYCNGITYSTQIFLDRIIFEIASSIASKTKLLILGFCLHKYLHQSSIIFDSRVKIAKAVGAQFIDIRSLILEFGEKIAGEGEELFRDQWHPQSIISKAIGKALARALKYDNINRCFEEVRVQCYRGNFHIWSADKQFAGPILNFKNSMFEENYANIKVGESLEFDIPGVCIGYNINNFVTSCDVYLEGVDRIASIKSYFNFGQDVFSKIFCTIPDGIRLKKLTVTDNRTEPFTVRYNGSKETIIAFASRYEPEPDAPTQLTISRMAYWTGTPQESWSNELSNDFNALELNAAVRTELANMRHSEYTLSSTKLRSLLASDSSELYLFSSHGTVIVYNLNLDECQHVEPAQLAGTSHLFNVKFRLDGTKIALSSIIRGMEVSLQVRSQDGTIGYQALTDAADFGSLKIFNKMDSFWAVKYGSSYLSAEPGGKLICNRASMGAWEQFELRPSN